MRVNCKWCGASYENTMKGAYCSKRCLEQAKAKAEEKWDRFTGAISNRVQIAQLQQQQELAAQQNALIAEQNQRLAAEETERRRVQELTEREASWKQFIFEVNELLDELTSEGDDISMLAQAEWFQAKASEASFTERDLKDIADKKYFAKTRRRVSAICETASEQDQDSYKEFKGLYRKYQNLYSGRTVFPDSKNPKYKKKSLPNFDRVHPEKKTTPKRELDNLLAPPQELSELRSQSTKYIVLMVLCAVGGLWTCGLTVAAAVWLYYSKYKPLGDLRRPLEEQFSNELRNAQRERQSQDDKRHNRAVEKWNEERQAFLASVSARNAEIVAHNNAVTELYDKAQAKWLARKQESMDQINSFIAKHPALERWYPRIRKDMPVMEGQEFKPIMLGSGGK